MLEHYLPEELFKSNGPICAVGFGDSNSGPLVRGGLEKRLSKQLGCRAKIFVASGKGASFYLNALNGKFTARGRKYKNIQRQVYNLITKGQPKHVFISSLGGNDAAGRGTSINNKRVTRLYTKLYTKLQSMVTSYGGSVQVSGSPAADKRRHRNFDVRRAKVDAIQRFVAKKLGLTHHSVREIGDYGRGGDGYHWYGKKRMSRYVDHLSKKLTTKPVSSSPRIASRLPVSGSKVTQPAATTTQPAATTTQPAATTTQPAATELPKLKKRLSYLMDRNKEYGDVADELKSVRTKIQKLETKPKLPGYTPKYKSTEYINRGDYKKIAGKIHTNYGSIIDSVASKYGKTPNEVRDLKLFISGTIAAETGGRPTLKGPVLSGTDRYGQPKRAYGLTQFLPGTARKMATKYLGMSGEDFDKKWKSGGWKDPKLMIPLTAVYFNNLKSNIQKRYKKIHGKDLVGDDLLNAVHIAYSHGPGNKYFVNRLKVGDFSPKGFSSGKDAPGYNSKAANARIHYAEYLPKLDKPIKHRPIETSFGTRSPRSAPESSGDVWANRMKEKKAKAITTRPLPKPSHTPPKREEPKTTPPKQKEDTTSFKVEQYKPKVAETSTQPLHKPQQSVTSQHHRPQPQHASAPTSQPQEQPQQVAQTQPSHKPQQQVAQTQHRPNPPLVLQKRRPQSIPIQGQPLVVSLGGMFESGINNNNLSKSIFRLEEYREI